VERDDARAVARTRAALPATLLLLGLASTAFDLGSVLWKAPLLRPGVTIGDFIEAAGVYVVLHLFARAGRLSGTDRGVPSILAALAGVTFAFGHGIHLAGNSIHDLLGKTGIGDPTGLLDFWDEHVGHYLIDSARVLFALALTWAGLAAPADASRARHVPSILGGAAYGFITFASSVEGQTVPLVLPFYCLYAAWTALGAKGRPGASGPVGLFFATAAWTALIFFAIWGIWQRGFPEFTSVGLIPSAS